MRLIWAIDTDTVTVQHNKEFLCMINPMKEKRCVKVKGRTYADGRLQQEYIPHEEVM